MTVYGDPTVLNDVGNDMMSAGKGLTSSWRGMGAFAALPVSTLGRAGTGTPLGATYNAATEALEAVVSTLGATLEDDGYHLQRASLEIDVVMNVSPRPRSRFNDVQV